MSKQSTVAKLTPELLNRLKGRLATWQRAAYMTSIEIVDALQAPALMEAMEAVASIRGPGDYDRVRALIERLRNQGPSDGGLDLAYYHSCASVLCDHPQIARDEEAEEHNRRMEVAARNLCAEGSPALRRHLSAVARHRGHACLRRGEYTDSLDHFIVARDELPEAPMNHQNVLIALVRIDVAAAKDHWRNLQTDLPAEVAEAVSEYIKTDPYLLALRA